MFTVSKIIFFSSKISTGVGQVISLANILGYHPYFHYYIAACQITMKRDRHFLLYNRKLSAWTATSYNCKVLAKIYIFMFLFPNYSLGKHKNVPMMNFSLGSCVCVFFHWNMCLSIIFYIKIKTLATWNSLFCSFSGNAMSEGWEASIISSQPFLYEPFIWMLNKALEILISEGVNCERICEHSGTEP